MKIFNRDFFTLCAFVIFAFPLSLHAMSFNASPPILYLGGPVASSDWDAWQEAMTRFDSQITTIVFHDSGGGDSAAGRKIGNDIRKRGFSIVVAGRCASACANMFLGGVTRQFATASTERPQPFLGYHGSYNKRTKEMNRNRTGDYFVQMTDGKMDEAFVERFIRIEKSAGLMRFFHREQLKKPTDALVQLCTGLEEHAKRDEQCERLNDIDAVEKGVITTWEMRDVGMIPTATKERLTFMSWRSTDGGNTTPDFNDPAYTASTNAKPVGSTPTAPATPVAPPQRQNN